MDPCQGPLGHPGREDVRPQGSALWHLDQSIQKSPCVYAGADTHEVGALGPLFDRENRGGCRLCSQNMSFWRQGQTSSALDPSSQCSTWHFANSKCCSGHER